MDDKQKEAWRRAMAAKQQRTQGPVRGGSQKGIGPNKAAGRKGGIRRQGSKRG